MGDWGAGAMSWVLGVLGLLPNLSVLVLHAEQEDARVWHKFMPKLKVYRETLQE